MDCVTAPAYLAETGGRGGWCRADATRDAHHEIDELVRAAAIPAPAPARARCRTPSRTWSTILKVTKALGLRFELHTVA
jgi:hypothetical protein